jgi:DNA invertase Pin-like site-specific DNA recombinase
MARRRSKVVSFPDFAALQGMPTRAYIRESSKRQAEVDRYGPDTQRAGIREFCDRWGLFQPDKEYFDTRSGRRVEGRDALQAALTEADEYKVLLVYVTSRSFRNREDAVIWKRKLRAAGVVLVFVQQGIISGDPRHKLIEGFNEIVDEQYSDTQGMLIAGGLRQKFEKGGVNGVPSLGYKRFHGDDGDPRNGGLIIDERGKSTVRAVVDRYLTGQHSTASIAVDLGRVRDEHGNPMYTTRVGRPVTKGSVEEILRNRTYTGVSVWRPGTPEEEIRPGTHEPIISTDEWREIEAIRERRTTRRGRRPTSRAYALSPVAKCFHCRGSFAGDTGGRLGKRRMRHTVSVACENRRSFQADTLEAQMSELLGERLKLPSDWRQTALDSLSAPRPVPPSQLERRRLEKALGNAKELFTWGDLERGAYLRQRDEIQRELSALDAADVPAAANLDRAAELLNNLGQLWLHTGVSGARRRELIDEVFSEILIDEDGIRRLVPREEYLPLIAVADVSWGGNGRGDWI